MNGAALSPVVAPLVFALVALFAEPVAGALSRFFSRYPLINLTSERQHRVRPSVVRIGAIIMLVASYFLQNFQ